MKKLTYEDWVIKFLTNVAGHFDLGGWNLDVKFSDREKDDTYAEATINSTYQIMTIHVFKKAKEDFESGNMPVLIMALVHELVHSFLDPFHSFVNPHLSEVTTPHFMNILEQQTQKLTMVILKTLPKNLIPPR